MKFEYFDIHSHLNLKPLSEDVSGVIARMQEKSVGTITVGTGLETSKEAIRLAGEYPDILWATVGIHPVDVSSTILSDPSRGSEWATFETLAKHPKVVAIGETGLDYFRKKDPELIQKQTELFKKHIDLAQKVGKPLMLHVRASKGSDDAYYDALEILRESAARPEAAPLRANFHFFSGSKKCMEDIVAAGFTRTPDTGVTRQGRGGFTISVDGPITFTNEYDDMIRACPIESIMAETDAPFAAPVPYRGKPCEPWMVSEVVKRIAEIKGIPIEETQKVLLENVQKVFDIQV